MNQAARRIGRSLALVLPAVLVLSGTLAVFQVPWATPGTDDRMLTASSERPDDEAEAPTAQDVLRDQLITELQRTDPTTALTSLQAAMDRTPSLGKHCADIARALGQAAVDKYGSLQRAQQHARPVCDTAFATGVADAH